jgi:hypothetical protein
VKPHGCKYPDDASITLGIVHASSGRARQEDREAVAEGEADYLFERADRDQLIARIRRELESNERARQRLDATRRYLDDRDNELHGRLEWLTSAPLDGSAPWADIEAADEGDW